MQNFDYEELLKGIEMGGLNKERKAEDNNGLTVESEAIVLNINKVDEVIQLIHELFVDGQVDNTKARALRKSKKLNELVDSLGVGELVALAGKLHVESEEHAEKIMWVVKNNGVVHRLAACMTVSDGKVGKMARVYLSRKTNNIEDAKKAVAVLTILRGKVDRLEEVVRRLINKYEKFESIEINAILFNLMGKIKLGFTGGWIAKDCVNRADEIEKIRDNEEDRYIKGMYNCVLRITERHSYMYEYKDDDSRIKRDISCYRYYNGKVYGDFNPRCEFLYHASDEEIEERFLSKEKKSLGIEINEFSIMGAIKIGMSPVLGIKRINERFGNVEIYDINDYVEFYRNHWIERKEAEELFNIIRERAYFRTRDEELMKRIVIATRGSRNVDTKEYVVAKLEKMNMYYVDDIVIDYLYDVAENFDELKDRAIALIGEYINSNGGVDHVHDTLEYIVKLADIVDDISEVVPVRVIENIVQAIYRQYIDIDAEYIKEVAEIAAEAYGIEIDIKRPISIETQRLAEEYGYKHEFGKRAVDIMIDKNEEELVAHILNIDEESEPFVETVEPLKSLLGEYECDIMAPPWWNKFKALVLADVKDEKKEKVEAALDHMAANPLLIDSGRVKENGTKLLKMLRKAVKKGIKVENTEWWSMFNLLRGKNDSELTYKITDSSLTKLGVSVFSSHWRSCLHLFDGEYKQGAISLVVDPEVVVLYVTDGKEIEVEGVTHDNMVARALLRILRNEDGDIVGILLDRIYADGIRLEWRIEHVVKRECSRLGLDVYRNIKHVNVYGLDDYKKGKGKKLHCYAMYYTRGTLPYMDTMNKRVSTRRGRNNMAGTVCQI